MTLISLLLAALTFAPMGMQQPAAFQDDPYVGYLASQPLASENCKPGAICSSTTLNYYDCRLINVYTSTMGGTPLAIDSTQTAPKSATYVYWVNNTNKTIVIKKQAYIYYRCKGKS